MRQPFNIHSLRTKKLNPDNSSSSSNSSSNSSRNKSSTSSSSSSRNSSSSSSSVVVVVVVVAAAAILIVVVVKGNNNSNRNSTKSKNPKVNPLSFQTRSCHWRLFSQALMAAAQAMQSAANPASSSKPSMV